MLVISKQAASTDLKNCVSENYWAIQDSGLILLINATAQGHLNTSHPF
jgi:hypothetical protein